MWRRWQYTKARGTNNGGDEQLRSVSGIAAAACSHGSGAKRAGIRFRTEFGRHDAGHDINHGGGIAMCFGGGSSKAPKPQAPTTFQYGPADNSNGQQQKAAIASASSSTDQAAFGSELGTAGATTGAVPATGQ